MNTGLHIHFYCSQNDRQNSFYSDVHNLIHNAQPKNTPPDHRFYSTCEWSALNMNIRNSHVKVKPSFVEICETWKRACEIVIFHMSKGKSHIRHLHQGSLSSGCFTVCDRSAQYLFINRCYITSFFKANHLNFYSPKIQNHKLTSKGFTICTAYDSLHH